MTENRIVLLLWFLAGYMIRYWDLNLVVALMVIFILWLMTSPLPAKKGS
jgi:hypothetical protein